MEGASGFWDQPSNRVGLGGGGGGGLGVEAGIVELRLWEGPERGTVRPENRERDVEEHGAGKASLCARPVRQGSADFA